jgi:hypothetical protein
MMASALRNALPDSAAVSGPARRFSELLVRSGPAVVASRLLVRSGRHGGAWITLHGERLRLGRADDSDIVVTDPEMPMHAGDFVATLGGWQFERDPPAEAGLPGEPGEVVRTLPQTLRVPAEGESTSGARFRRRRWELHGVTFVVIDTASMHRPEVKARLARFRQVAVVAGASVVVAASLLVLVWMVAPSFDSKYKQVSESLAGLRLGEVILRRGEGSQVLLSGHVADGVELARLKAWSHGFKAVDFRFQVRSAQELVNRVRESIGEPLQIKVQYLSHGRVRVDGSTASHELKRRVQALVADMKPVAEIEDHVALIEMREPPAEKLLPIRIVNVMPGAQPFFQTEAGATYTLGGRLPDGAEVVAIEATQVVFRLKGRAITYRLDTADPLGKP